MTGYRLHELLLSIAACAVIFGALSMRGCQQAEAIRIERMELERFHRELIAAYGVTPGENPAGLPSPEGFKLVPAAPGEPGTLLVELNAASRRVLEGLPGIGETTATAIITTRNRLGRFMSVDDLLEVPGIGETTLEAIRPHVWVEPVGGERPDPAAPLMTPRPAVPPITEAYTPHAAAMPTPAPQQSTPTPIPTPVVTPYRPAEAHQQYMQQRARDVARNAATGTININTATIQEFASLDGIGEGKALDIIAHRNAYGRFGTVDDLANVKGIGEKTIAKNRHRLRCE